MGATETKFYSETYGTLSLTQVISHIQDFIEEQPDESYTLTLGSDSHEQTEATGTATLNLVTAIVIYRKGFGAQFFWKRKYLQNIHSLREKIYAETIESLDFAKIFVPLIQESLTTPELLSRLEIHVDVGEYGATREMIKEVVGMVRGMGYIARTKPYSFAASYVADKYT